AGLYPTGPHAHERQREQSPTVCRRGPRPLPHRPVARKTASSTFGRHTRSSPTRSSSRPPLATLRTNGPDRSCPHAHAEPRGRTSPDAGNSRVGEHSPFDAVSNPDYPSETWSAMRPRIGWLTYPWTWAETKSTRCRLTRGTASARSTISRSIFVASIRAAALSVV